MHIYTWRTPLAFNPLRPSGESCSDLAEIFSMAFFNFKKKYLILYLDFLSRTVKKLLTILYLYFLKIYYSAMFKKKFYTSVLGFSLVSQELITIEII
jgi:hypothetical protein